MSLGQLKLLQCKRDYVGAKFVAIENFAKNVSEKNDVNDIKNRIDELPSLRKQYEDFTFEIIATESTEDEKRDKLEAEELSMLSEFNDKYHELLSKLQKLHQVFSSKKELPVAETKPSVEPFLNIRLPEVQIQSFSGNYADWLPFYDTFKNLIHDNKNLNDCTKLHYLKGYLKGEALRSVESLTSSNDNYKVAWDILEKRYHNTRLIVQDHIKTILGTPDIGKPPTVTAYRKMIDDVRTNIGALRVLKMPVDHWDALLVSILTPKLDFNARKDFETSLSTEIPSLESFLEFLEKRCMTLESMQDRHPRQAPVSTNTNNNNSKFKYTQPTRAYNNLVLDSRPVLCYFCKKNHYVSDCAEFLQLSLDERFKQVKNRKLCTNCLRGLHKTSECRATACKTCNQRHHTLLHGARSNPENAPPRNTQTSGVVNQTSGVVNCAQSQQDRQVILSTACLMVKDAEGKYHQARALLDVGSQLNIISGSFCKLLKLPTSDANVSIVGINNLDNRISKCTKIHFKSLHTQYHNEINCYVLEKITGDIPSSPIHNSKVRIPENITIADPSFNTPSPVDLLIGAELFWELILADRVPISQNLFLINTQLGYVIGGSSSLPQNSMRCHLAIKDETDGLRGLIENFWKQEEVIDSSNNWTKEETECEQHFVDTYTRESDGRFIVQLPIKNNVLRLGETEQMALKRFLSLERKFKRDTNFKSQYVNAVNELESSGFIRELSQPDDRTSSRKTNYYLPHSGVAKSSDSKIRVVYDGSAKSSNGLSLNDNLMTGPNLQNDLFTILIRFRWHQVVISCDIQKMFQQIKIDEGQLDLQRILWRESESESIKIYVMTRLVFGLTNSPYTAMRCMRQLAIEFSDEYPRAAEVLKSEVFMDDILTGADTINDAIALRDQIVTILGNGCFQLSKWHSNDGRVLPNLFRPEEASVKPIMLGEEDGTTKVLGLSWNPRNDTLGYHVRNIEIPRKITKRNILSSTARLFDPIGMISPVIVQAKLIMQKLWSLSLGWDDSVPPEIERSWVKFVNSLDSLTKLEIPRKLFRSGSDYHELIVFCDASLRAHGAAVYMRTHLPNGGFSVRLISSKSKINPLTVVTLPRLELCAALLAVKLKTKVAKALDLTSVKTYYFSDSMIVLHYIKSDPRLYQTFVANRVSQIRELSNPQDWRHIDSKNNPADIISRGAYPEQVISSDVFWHGPEFLRESTNEWPEGKFNCNSLSDKLIPEKRQIVMHLTNAIDFPVLSKFSKFSKLLRVMAYCLRFLNNIRRNRAKRHGPIVGREISGAKIEILKVIQRKEFAEELHSLRNNLNINRNSRLLTLDPFLGNDGLIRVGGRLRNASVSYEVKHPIILPSNNHVTKLIIQFEHTTLLHAGPNQTLASLRTQYWPLRARDEIRRVIHSCMNCFRLSPRLVTQKMGDIPKDRLEPCRPFSKIGVDYLGPILLKSGGKRSKTLAKSWVALFVCFYSKAVHLEIVSDLTSMSFINALKRLIARRGKVSCIYCDNATNFVGAKRELDEVSEFLKKSNSDHEINTFLSREEINWKFIPPRAPNFGGLWERLVKSVKQHFKRVTLSSHLTFEEATTLISQIEAVINSRPLSPLSDSPSDFQVLTPAHFLIGEPLTSLCEIDITSIQSNRLDRWERIQQLRQHFWKRWSREVLVQMQPREKWCRATSNLVREGALVLIAEDNLPPLVWKTGRVEELFPGLDGILRVVSVRTSQGTYKRPVRKLAIIPHECKVE